MVCVYVDLSQITKREQRNAAHMLNTTPTKLLEYTCLLSVAVGLARGFSRGRRLEQLDNLAFFLGDDLAPELTDNGQSCTRFDQQGVCVKADDMWYTACQDGCAKIVKCLQRASGAAAMPCKDFTAAQSSCQILMLAIGRKVTWMRLFAKQACGELMTCKQLLIAICSLCRC